MRKLVFYIDTSVIGGFFDEEFEFITQVLFQKFQEGEYDFIISDLTLKELIKAPERVKLLINRLNLNPSIVSITPEAITLAGEYLKEKVVEYED